MKGYRERLASPMEDDSFGAGWPLLAQRNREAAFRRNNEAGELASVPDLYMAGVAADELSRARLAHSAAFLPASETRHVYGVASGSIQPATRIAL